MHMAGVLLDELGESNVIRSQFAESVEDAGFTGVKERQVLGHLEGKGSGNGVVPEPGDGPV